MTDCTFRTVSEHRTSLGRVRYQTCVCGRLRVLLDDEVVTRRPVPAERAPRRLRAG